jgi:hypothetical protein
MPDAISPIRIIAKFVSSLIGQIRVILAKADLDSV